LPPRIGALGAATLTLAVLLLTAPALAQGEIIRPGREAQVSELVAGGGAPLPGGCSWIGAQIERARIVARYACPTSPEPAILELLPPSSSMVSVGKTDKFVLATPDSARLPADLLAAVEAGIRAKESGWIWDSAVDPVPAKSSPPAVVPTVAEALLASIGLSFHAGLAAALLSVGAALVAGALLLARDRRAGAGVRLAPAEGPSIQSVPIAWITAASLTIISLWMAARFQFASDDSRQLMLAEDQPWQVDDSLRLLSCTLLFRAGTRAPVYALANLAAFASALASLHLLARRAGAGRGEALLGAALAGYGPGFFLLLRFGVAFQTLVALALIHASILVFDRALSAERPLARWGAALLFAGMVGAGVFVKYPMMSLVPPACWIWGALVTRARLRERWVLFVVPLVAVAVPLVLAHPAGPRGGELSKAGLSQVVHNVGALAELLEKNVADLGSSLLLLYAVVQIVHLRAGRAEGERWSSWPRLLDLVGREWARLRRPILLFTSLSVAFVLPFLFNASYFAPYYAAPMFAWLAVLAARTLAEPVSRLTGVARVASIVVGLAIVPVSTVRAQLADADRRDRGRALMLAIRAATRGRPAPCGISLAARCDTRDATDDAGRRLDEMYFDNEGGAAVRWATGFHETRVSPVDDHERLGHIPGNAECRSPLALEYCEATGVRVVAPSLGR
jgi:hypothetical protein